MKRADVRKVEGGRRRQRLRRGLREWRQLVEMAVKRDKL